MKEKLLAAFAYIKPYLDYVYSWSPFVTGLLLGYFGKPIIQFVLGLFF